MGEEIAQKNATRIQMRAVEKVSLPALPTRKLFRSFVATWPACVVALAKNSSATNYFYIRVTRAQPSLARTPIITSR